MTQRHGSIDSVRFDGEPKIDIRNFPQPPAWTIDAVCAQIDPEGFFPEKGQSNVWPKQICGSCPVATQCLQYALDNNEAHGIWGGLSARERRQMTRDRAAS